MTKPILIAVFLINFTAVISQTTTDTIKTHKLSPVTVEGNRIPLDIHRLEPVQGTYIYSGKKNEVIDMAQKNVAITEKYGRQIFAKIPGVFVYDMDGTGNQVNISTRGLDAHRSWEFNVRKDGIITNSDMYGYPASHYNIPMEALERIELVRGTASLQYGAQFGGMLNYISKQPDSKKLLLKRSIRWVLMVW
ncbi:TonB-dependent receptor plug domain-containing protein [Flavobacterium sp. P21]|uniref:TonB-dependent receptor plug domain-containing protein n=1 Tax=Flavobacterium sp. P21 TaxID=3423948 RepID=UPI003D66FDF8